MSFSCRVLMCKPLAGEDPDGIARFPPFVGVNCFDPTSLLANLPSEIDVFHESYQAPPPLRASMNWFAFNPGDFAVSFLSVLLEGIPFLLLGSIISGVIEACVSPQRLAAALPRNPTLAVCVSGLLGLVFPMCECGSVVIIRRFLKKGLPLGSAVTYMLAAPIVSPIVAISTLAAFRGQFSVEMATLRLSLGLIIGVVAGLVVQRFPVKTILRNEAGIYPESTAGRGGLKIASTSGLDEPVRETNKVLTAIYTASTDFLDVAVFFIIGAAITSILGTSIDRTALAPIATNVPLSIFGMMGLAAALALCSTTDAFIAATSFGMFPMTAKLAFLLFGPMFDLKLYWLYGILFQKRVVIILAISLFLGIGLLCWRLTGIFF